MTGFSERRQETLKLSSRLLSQNHHQAVYSDTGPSLLFYSLSLAGRENVHGNELVDQVAALQVKRVSEKLAEHLSETDTKQVLFTRSILISLSRNSSCLWRLDNRDIRLTFDCTKSR